MGGIIILASIVIPTLLFAKLGNVYIILMLISTVWLGLIGFLDDYIKIYLHDTKPVLPLMSLKSILEKLPKEQFMRVHRSFIVPLGSILSIRNRRIYLDQREIPIGETFHESVKEWLSNRKLKD